MPYKLKDPVRHKFKKKVYNKRDWKAYDRGLINRGNITIWFSQDAVSGWHPPRDVPKQRGRQQQYTDLSIETALTLRLVFHLPLRQTEGFVSSIISMLKLDLRAPDHSTMSKRGKVVRLSKKSESESDSEGICVIVDSTGVKVFGEKEWMNYKHGTRQRKVWRKLHLCIDKEGKVLSSKLTCHTQSDPSAVDSLLKDIQSPIDEFIADGAYDAEETYNGLNNHKDRLNQENPIKAIIPPNTGFREARETDDPQRLHNIRVIEDKGKAQWQKNTNFGQRARVENTMYRYKSTFGSKLKSRDFQNQITETQIAVQVLNRMASLGMPKAEASI